MVGSFRPVVLVSPGIWYRPRATLISPDRVPAAAHGGRRKGGAELRARGAERREQRSAALSEEWSGGSFVGCYRPLPGARRGHLICGVIDKCGRRAAVPASPPPIPHPRPRASPSSLSAPSLLPARSAARQRAAPVGICLPLGAPPALAAEPPAPRRAGPRLCRLPRLPAGRCCGRLRGKLRVARSPGKFSALGNAALGPLPFAAASPRGWVVGCGKPGRDRPGTARRQPPPRWPPPPSRARPLRDSPRGRGRAPGVARFRGHRRPGVPVRRLRTAGPEENGRRGEGSARGRRGCGPRRRA